MLERFQIEEGWTTFLLVLVLIITAALGVVQADLINGLNVIPSVGGLAVIAGFVIAKSSFRPRVAHLISFVYGLFVLGFFLAPLFAGETWREQLIDLLARQLDWFEKAANGGTSRDGLIFVIQTSAIFWLLGYTASWYTFRVPRVWRVVVPTGVVLLTVVYYYVGSAPMLWYMAFYVLFSLMFVTRTYLADREKVWRAAAVRYESAIRFDFMRAGFIAALVAIFLSTLAPAGPASALVNDALSGTQGPWRQFQDTWTRLFSSLRAYGTGVSDPYQDTLVLGGPRSVGNTPIMDIFVERELPNVYWQAIAYDTYENGRWSAQRVTQTDLHFPDDGELDVPLMAARREVDQTVRNYLPNSSFLYAAPQVIGSNKQMFVEGQTLPNGDRLIASIRSRYVLRQGDTYQVTSLMSNADIQGLQFASGSYPDWITANYLDIPSTVSPETIALAEQLTAGLDNNFDKALAVRDYLRANIEYNDQIDAPPDGMDPVHYILFVNQEGYCNYYASAMAVMLRSQGIPARVVSGYAQGDFDPESMSYRVRASNAHTWVEVYFQRYGWIQFEPTASIPVVSRPNTQDTGDAFASSTFFPDDNRPQLDEFNDFDFERGGDVLDDNPGVDFNQSSLANFPIWQALGAIVTVVAAGGVLFAAQQMNQRAEADVERSYDRLGRWASWLGLRPSTAQTPYERADMLVTAVPEGSQPIRSLTRQFVLSRFSRTQIGEEGYDPHAEWKLLRPMLYRQMVNHRVQNLQQRLSRK